MYSSSKKRQIKEKKSTETSVHTIH